MDVHVVVDLKYLSSLKYNYNSWQEQLLYEQLMCCIYTARTELTTMYVMRNLLC